MRSAPRPITSVPGFVRRRNGAGVGRVYPLFQMPKGSVMTRLLIAALVAAIAAPVLAAMNVVRAQAISMIILERSKLPGDQRLNGIRLQ